MNTHDENHQPAPVDEYQDRLIERGLAEVIGRETPPDLSGRIVAAAAAQKPMPAAATNHHRISLTRWTSWILAASLLVGGTVALLQPAVYSARESARRSSIDSKNHGRAITLGNTRSYRATNPPTGDLAALKSLHEPADRSASVDQFNLTEHAGEFAGGPIVVSTLDGAAPQLESSLVSELTRAAPTDAKKLTQLDLRLEDQTAREVAGDFYFGYRNVRFAPWAEQTANGTGPGLSGDQYTRITENPFITAEGVNAVSTFSIDVDTASYANVRQFLMDMNTLPPPDAVRIEELVNYFDYDYAGPPADATDSADTTKTDEVATTSSAPGSAGGPNDAAVSTDAAPAPFSAHVEVAGCPWKPEHRLVRIGIKGREMDRNKRPLSNLVFLVDVSGSMNEPNKLPLVVYGLEQLTRELGKNDRVAIVVYASSEGLVLPSTPGSNQQAILAALSQLRAGGSTAGGAGIQLAYQVAEDHFIAGGTNRVILCTDGDFNVGVTSTAELERLCEQKAKDTGVFLSVLGFGRGNLNDAMMETISNRGNGNYHYVDNRTEARRVLVEEMTGTLVTIAKDVKIQVEFNPRQVAGYRLIGYENRMLRTEDFNDDTKDAGEIGAGHTVTAFYEVVPAGQTVDIPAIDPLKYQPAPSPVPAESTGPPAHFNGVTPIAADAELLTLKMRYKTPDGATSRKLEWPVVDAGQAFGAASDDFQFAASVAGFGMLLRDSQFKGNLTYSAVLEMAQSEMGRDEHGHRAEFLVMVRRAKSLRGE